MARSGWANALLASATKAPTRTSSVHTLLIRTATYTMRRRTRVTCECSPGWSVSSSYSLLLPASASAAPRVEHLKFKYGPVVIKPGQNTISIDGDGVPKPKRPGWIVGFRPNLERVNGKIPRVDVLHLHHAVWLINGAPTFAAGEEKTNVRLPKGFGWRYEPSRPVGAQPHDPQPAAEPRPRLHHLHARLHPRHVAGGEGHPPDRDALARRRGRQGLPGVRRPSRQRPERALHLPRRRAQRLRRRLPAQPDDDPARRRARPDRRPPAPRRSLHRPHAHARRPQRSTSSARARSTGSRRARCHGTSR